LFYIWHHNSVFQANQANYSAAMTFILVFNTCPDLETARKIAEKLVNQKMAACVNIVPTIFSVYEWQGKIEQEQEHLLFIKTHKARYAELEALIREIHPYELPEIIAVPISNGLPGYLDWVNKNTGGME